VPDHATIARFVVRRETALADLFGAALKLCDQAGLVKPGVVAIDATRLAGNASNRRNRGFERIAREIPAEAKATDAAEDEEHGETRGDELPDEQLRTAEGRREFLRHATQRGDDQYAREELADKGAASGEARQTGPAVGEPPDEEQSGERQDDEPGGAQPG